MKYLLLLTTLLIAGCSGHHHDHAKSEWQSLFDGKSLSGWDGDPKFWKIENGAITGQTTAEKPTKGNTFIIFVGESKDNTPVEFGDFELKIDYRIHAGNSGVQYRSFKKPGDHDGWRIGGYQADLDFAKGWAGTNYGEAFRGILAKRGEKATLTGKMTEVKTKKGMRKVPERKVEALADSEVLKKAITDAPKWNEMHIIAKGNVLTQKINGVVMSVLIDNDAAARAKGLLALQLHQGPPMKVQFKNIRIKK